MFKQSSVLDKMAETIIMTARSCFTLGLQYVEQTRDLRSPAGRTARSKILEEATTSEPMKAFDPECD